MTYRPTGDRILLERIERPKPAILLVNPMPGMGTTEAKVIALGPLVPENCGIKAGDTVLLRTGTGEHDDWDGRHYWQVSWQRNDPIMVKV
jgi:co-chaperonin GroES (HSP10)